MKKGIITNLEEETLKNRDFRKVLYTGKFSQLVFMCLKPKEEIEKDTHDAVDQFFRFEDGRVVEIDNIKKVVIDGSGVVVP